MKIGNAATPVALVVLAIGTAGYAYFVDRGRISDADRAARRTDVFPTFRVDQVRRVELVHGAETLALERDAAQGADGQPGWSMTSPRPDAADPAAVDALLRELEMAARVRTVSDDDAELGTPRVRGRVTVGPVEYHFVLGADAPTPEGAAYMRLEGEGTFVVERTLKVQLQRGADAYRERALVPYGASDVARLEVGTPGGATVALERRGTAFPHRRPGRPPRRHARRWTISSGRSRTRAPRASSTTPLPRARSRRWCGLWWSSRAILRTRASRSSSAARARATNPTSRPTS